MRRWSMIVVLAGLAGCGEERQPMPAAARAVAETPTMTCASGFSFSDGGAHLAEGRRARAVVAGPVTLLGLDDLRDVDLGRRRALLVKAVVAPHAPATTVAVAQGDRAHVSLSPQVPSDPYQPPEGDPAIRLEGCAPRTDDSVEGEELGTGYAIAVVVDGPRCAAFDITSDGTRTIRRTVSLGAGRCAVP